MPRETIGFIGLGIMGTPMAGHLLRAGHELVAYDIRPERARALADLGARQGSSPSDVAAHSDVVISMVVSFQDVERVYLGENGVLEGARPGTLCIDMTTSSPMVARRVAEAAAEHGCAMLDAPVSGGDVGAQMATLSIMVGGPKETFERARPILEILGKPVHCGAWGAGQTVKACNQIQVSMALVGMAEALVLGQKAGVDPAVIVEVLSNGYAQTRVMDVRGPRLLSGDMVPGGRCNIQHKDLGIILDTAKALGCSLPASALAHELYAATEANGWAELDHSAVIHVIELLSGMPAGTTRAHAAQGEPG